MFIMDESKGMDYRQSNALGRILLGERPLWLRMDAVNFADRFRWARDRAGVTQREIATHCGLTNRAVSAWENGRAAGMLAETLYCVADFLRVDARWLATGDGSPERQPDPLGELTDEQRAAVKALVSSIKA